MRDKNNVLLISLHTDSGDVCRHCNAQVQDQIQGGPPCKAPDEKSVV